MVALAKQYHVSPNPISTRNEWYTPYRYIEAARTVMGGIDLDPASSPEANLVVRATRFYTREDNGLEQKWYGNIWLNPPFVSEENKSSFTLWTKKLLSEYQQGNVKQAIALISATPERKWFHPLWEYPICFTNHQIIFNRPKNKPNHLYTCTCFVYLGAQEAKFMEAFRSIGHIVPVMDVTRSNVTPSLWQLRP